LPVIVALNRFGSDTEREFEMIGKHLGEQGVEALVCELASRPRYHSGRLMRCDPDAPIPYNPAAKTN
jgi:hypothetical protein